MICTDPAVSDPSEGQVEVCKLDDRIVYAPCTERNALQHHALLFAVLRKKVQGERLRPCVDERDGFLKSLLFDNREKRTEYLLLHDPVFY